MAMGAIVNAEQRRLPGGSDLTLNARYVFRPDFQVPDKEKKFGNLTLTYAMQIHACVVEVDPETGYYEIVDYAAVDDCGSRINPKIVEGQVMGATAHAIGAAIWETFVVRRRRKPAHSELLRLPRATCDGHAAAQDGRDRVAVAVHPARHEGDGRGRRRRDPRVCAALQDALRTRGGALVSDSHNPYHRVWSMLQDPEATRANVEVMSK